MFSLQTLDHFGILFCYVSNLLSTDRFVEFIHVEGKIPYLGINISFSAAAGLVKRDEKAVFITYFIFRPATFFGFGDH